MCRGVTLRLYMKPLALLFEHDHVGGEILLISTTTPCQSGGVIFSAVREEHEEKH